jgi:hypothetical protein
MKLWGPGEPGGRVVGVGMVYGGYGGVTGYW